MKQVAWWNRYLPCNMKILRDIQPDVPAGDLCVGRSAFCATIGFFDGVHRGHCHLLRQVAEAARQRGLGTLAVTFTDHPRRALGGNYVPPLLTTPEAKLQLLAATGLDACALLDFTPALASLGSAEFMERYLLRALRVRSLVIGYDHHFGHDRTAVFADYVQYGRQCGIEVIPALPLPTDGPSVSSSAVRRYLDEGAVAAAAEALGRPYALGGTVVEGRHNGRLLGFPTANLRPASAQLAVPAQGVYAARAAWNGRTWPAMVNIGHRPTLDNGNDVTIEAHLIGFSGDLYGTSLTLSFVSRLRDERTFHSLDALRHQLAADARQAQSILGV